MISTRTPTEAATALSTAAADQAALLAQRAAEQVQDLTRRGLDRARLASDELREQAHFAGELTRDYVQEKPVKAVLIAAAAGAALALLVQGLMSRRRD
jgi:ElaB/YqjD/DUF883 family membrane-anchored ribosome-binding protein